MEDARKREYRRGKKETVRQRDNSTLYVEILDTPMNDS